MHSVVETGSFLRDAAGVGMTDSERETIVLTISGNPLIGDLMPGTGGARKVRFAGRGKGKSGGYRVVTYYAAEDVPVFLLAIVSKGERADLSKREQNDLKSELSRLKDDYRAGTAARLAQLKNYRRHT
jgi:hypothetical protein